MVRGTVFQMVAVATAKLWEPKLVQTHVENFV